MLRRLLRITFLLSLFLVLVLATAPTQAQSPTATPSPTTTPTAAPATPAAANAGQAVSYVVQPGDTLFRISLRYGVTVQALAQANNIANPNLIFAGQSLAISGGSNTGSTGGGQTGTPPTGGNTGGATYTVVAGDTLSKIARQFNTSVQALAQANNIANPNLIIIGQVLQIPGATGGNTGAGTATATTPAPGGGTVAPPPPGGFEVGGHVLTFGNIEQMRSAGMTWAKVQIRFKLGDNPDITAQAINDAHLNGFKILLGIVGEKDQMASMPYADYVRAYAQFVGGVALLGPEAIEIWNEPNLDREWPAGQVNGATYTQLLKASYDSIKAVNSRILVISGAPAPTGFFGGRCTANGCDDNVFLAAMRDAGAANSMDCIGAHYNEGIVSPTQRSGDPRGNSGHYSRYFGTMLDLYHSTFNGAKPVCWTELGYATPEGFNVAAPPGFDWANGNTLAEHTQWLGESVSLSRSSGKVRVMIIWNVNFTSSAPDPSGMYAIVRPDGNCAACARIRSALQ
jgi:LysM repeat protein